MKTRGWVACGLGLLGISLASTPPVFAQSPGALDATFQPRNPGAQYNLFTPSVQRDGKILLARSGADSGESGIWRLNADGSLDADFANPTLIDGDWLSCLEQPDGKILVSGFLRLAGGQFDFHKVIRLHANGSIDSTFNPSATTNRNVVQLAQMGEGLLVTGFESREDGQTGFVLKLNADGSTDHSFVEHRNTNGMVFTALHGGRVYVLGYAMGTGNFTILDGNGVVLTNFQAGFNGYAENFFVQQDGKLVAQGYFHSADYSSEYSVVRLNADGTVDQTFPFLPAPEYGLAGIQPLANDGFLAFGGFEQFAGFNRTNIARFFADGTLDTSFAAPPMDGGLWRIAVQEDHRIIITGVFSQVAGKERRNVARLHSDAPPVYPTIQFSHLQNTVSETQRIVTLSVTANGRLSDATSFEVSAQEATAHDSIDYVSPTGPIRFAAGSTSATVTVSILNNDRVDGTRHFSVTFTNLHGVVAVSNSVATVTITDDEVNNRVQFSSASFPVKETQSHAVIEVIRDIGSTGAASVGYGVGDGSAQAGRDYIAVTGALHFATAQFTNRFLVPLLNTAAADGNRSATLRLFTVAPASNVVLGAQTTAALVLFDDESPAVLTTLNEPWLRAAVQGGGEIRFDADGEITLSRTIEVQSQLTIDGRGRGVMNGALGLRLFNIATGATLALHHVVLANGQSTNGGAIWNEGTLRLIGCTFSNNFARGFDGTTGFTGGSGNLGSRGGNGTAGQDTEGGAIVNKGRLLATNCAFIANAAIGGRGGNGGAGGFSSQFNVGHHGGNGARGGNASGGAIAGTGFALLYDCRFAGNTAQAGDGGAGEIGGRGESNNAPPGAPGTSAEGGHAMGGAVALLGPFEIRAGHFSGNGALAGQGGSGATGPDAYVLHLAGPGSPGLLGGTAKGGSVYAGATGVISRSTFRASTAIAGRGGKGGEGGASVGGYDAGSGGSGGDGGEACGGAVYSTEAMAMTANIFERCTAQGGQGAPGGDSGGSRYGATGGPGKGGNGGGGGDATGGAVFCRMGSFWNENIFFSNEAIAGDGASGGSPGSACLCIWMEANAGGAGGRGGDADGGAIRLTGGGGLMSDSRFTQNLSRSGAGGAGVSGTPATFWLGIFFGGGDGGNGGMAGFARAGAVSSSAELSISGSTIVSNTAVAAEAGDAGDGGPSRSRAGRGGMPGMAASATGGGLWSDAALTVRQSLFIANSAQGSNGGDGGSAGELNVYESVSADSLGLGRAGAAAGAARGGAIALLSNRVELVETTFRKNIVRGGSGGAAGVNSALEGYGALGISPAGGAGGEAHGGGIHGMYATIALRDSSFSDNRAKGGGAGITGPGGLYFGIINGSPVLPGAQGGPATGGAIFVSACSTELTRCSFDENEAAGGTGGTGGVRMQTGASGGEGGPGGTALGGAVNQTEGLLAITNSTFFSNGAVSGPGGTGGANQGGADGGPGGRSAGGGIYASTGLVFLVHGSLAENFSTAGPGGNGGQPGTNIVHTTGAPGTALGGTFANNASEARIVNSLFKHHSKSTNASGPFIDLGHNIDSDGSFAFTSPSSLTSVDPLVGALEETDGGTRALPLLSGSPAIDAADDSFSPATDQRGLARPFGVHADIGAWELHEPTFTIRGMVRERTGIAGVVVTAGNARGVTDALGQYQISNLLAGNYIVRPEAAGTVFAPASRHVRLKKDRDGVDFHARSMRLHSSHMAAGGEIIVRFDGAPGTKYAFETSTNLLHWTFIGTVIPESNGSCEFRYSSMIGEPHRFFRPRPLP